MDTKKKSITKKDILNDDKGILISDLFKLLKSTDNTAEEILKHLKGEFDEKEFIPIKGAQTLFNSQIHINSFYQKKDLISSLKDISFYNENDDFTINFSNIKDKSNYHGLSQIKSHPIYSSQRDFFGGLYNMDKYAKNLINNKLKKIVDANLILLKELEIKDRKYRLIYSNPDKEYYLRGIVSIDNYFDYNNSVAVVIGLLTLYSEMKNTGMEYSLKLCEYNESNIRIFFDTNETRELEGVGSVRNIIEISNDEIKREALKFSGICSILYGDKKDNSEIFIMPRDIKSKILTIKHNQKTETAFKSLINFENAGKIHDDLYEDIKTIKNIKNSEQVKFLIHRKIDKAKNENIKKYKNDIVNEITQTTTKNIIDLLNLFNRIQILANEDIEASEYLRFIIYEALIKRKRN